MLVLALSPRISMSCIYCRPLVCLVLGGRSWLAGAFAVGQSLHPAVFKEVHDEDEQGVDKKAGEAVG